MPSSGSSNSRSKDKQVRRPTSVRASLNGWIVALVWVARIVVGGVFIMSGVAKAIDPWGVFYKIGEYVTVWGLDVPRSLVLSGAVLLAVWEGLLGFMLLLGCYRRWSVWLLTATMAFMLPLSLYIYMYSPVADCGCFGDFLVISNSLTFWKNVIVTAILIFLIRFNARVRGLIGPMLQWTAGVVVMAYLVILCLAGYIVQPLEDFRSYPEGTMLSAADAAEVESEDVPVEFEFIYEKGGEQRTFKADNLPDSTWTFVDRRVIGGEIDDSDKFLVYDNGEDVTDEVIADRGEQILVLIPDIEQADISWTSYINALNRYITNRGGSLIGVIATDDEGLDTWRDIALAEYPLYTAEPTAIKELARGSVALVYLRDGGIVWKRAAASIDGEQMLESLDNRTLDSLKFPGHEYFKLLSVGMLIALAFIVIVDATVRIVRHGSTPAKRKPKLSKL